MRRGTRARKAIGSTIKSAKTPVTALPSRVQAVLDAFLSQPGTPREPHTAFEQRMQDGADALAASPTDVPVRRVLTRRTLAALVAHEVHLTQEMATLVVNATFHAIADSLRKGEEVHVARFGNFSVALSEERAGRRALKNPKAETAKQLQFTPGKGLKEAVND